ncbi:hypothetical protein JXC34_01155 [Candidatus Woesearchaeota archaeon]|nr:hypothetical protein [Candidatus Woesearchaeota archaeon]
MKKTLLLLMLVLTAAAVSAEQVKITKDGEGYGCHGSCGSWNACGTPATCAQWACQINGFSTVVSYEATNCHASGMNDCQLFNYNSGSVDCAWGMHCDVPVVTDIVCDNGSYNGYCYADIPPQDDEPEQPPAGDGVPEFTAIGAGLALVGAGIIAARRRKE